jgi:hypothetical protein
LEQHLVQSFSRSLKIGTTTNTCKQALAKDLNYAFSLYMEYPSGTQEKKKKNKIQKQSNQKHHGQCTQSQQDGTSHDDDSLSQGTSNAGPEKA